MTDDEVIAATLPAKSFRWSFSSWEVYNSCPAKWKFKHVLRLPGSPSGPAAARGSNLHDRVEKYIINQSPDLEPPEGLMFGDKKPAKVAPKYIPIINEYKNHPNGDRYAEKKLAFDANWDMCPPKSDFAACVAVLDAARFLKHRAADTGILHIAEWKSGKPKETHADQRKLYAMFGMRHWLADTVEVTTYYLEGTADPVRLVLKSEVGFNILKTLWSDRVALMARDTICAPKPTFQCTWCDYAKAKGGPCIFG
jgi:hypothetical protein